MSMEQDLTSLGQFLDETGMARSVILYPTIYSTQDEVRQVMATWPGDWSKRRSNGADLYFKKFGDITLEFWASNPACKRVKVGTKEVPATEARTEDVYEWQCPE